MKIKKGDTVSVISGRDKGKQGVVERVYKNASTLLIKDVNLYTRHVRKSQEFPDGGTVKIPRPIPASNVMLICPHTGKSTRIGYTMTAGKKSRMSKKADKVIS